MQQRLHAARRLSQQSAERVFGLLQTGLQFRDVSERALPQGARLRDVEFRRGAVAETRLGDVHSLFLHPGVFSSDLNELLIGAEQGVGARHFSGQRNERAIVIGDRRQQIRVVGLDVAPEAAPEIHLPGGVEAEVKIRERMLERGLVGEARTEKVLLRGAGTLLRLRIKIADRDAELRARFENFQTGDPHREILLVGALDEAIERRILERPPPVRLDVALRHALVAALDPFVLNGRCRREEIGAHGAAAQRQSQANRRNCPDERRELQGRRALGLWTTAHQHAALSLRDPSYESGPVIREEKRRFSGRDKRTATFPNQSCPTFLSKVNFE